MEKLIKLALACLVPVLGSLVGCQKEQVTILSVNQTDVTFQKEAGIQKVVVSTNRIFTASSNQSWCTVSPSSGDGSLQLDNDLTINCQENGTEARRSCKITINAGEKSIRVTVTQDADLTKVVVEEPSPVQSVSFADAVFEAYCLANFDTDMDGKISLDEANKITFINVCTDHIESLQGIEYMPKLSTLRCDESSFGARKGKLTSLDLSKNTALTWLSFEGNQLTELDLTNNTALKELYCRYNQLGSLNVTKNTRLNTLWCGGNKMKSLVIGQSTALLSLDCYGNQLTSLDVSKVPNLKDLACYNNSLTTLDVSKNTALTYISCEENHISSLDISKNTALTRLYCSTNKLTALDVRNNAALEILVCYGNQLTILDVTKNTKLKDLGCEDNCLASLDVSRNKALWQLGCSRNQLTSLDLSKNPALEHLACYNNLLSSLDVSNNPLLKSLWCVNNRFLTAVWLKKGQSIEEFHYDSNTAIRYK